MSKCNFCEEYGKAYHDPTKLHKKHDKNGKPLATYADYAVQGYYLNFCPECGRDLREIREEDKVYPSIYGKINELKERMTKNE